MDKDFSNSDIHRLSPNDDSIDKMKADVADWETRLYQIFEEMTFLNKYLKADIFEQNQPNLFENITKYLSKLKNLQTQKIEVTTLIERHKVELEEMLECDDLSCDAFYHKEHNLLYSELRKFLLKFDEYKLDVMKHTGDILLK